MGGPYFSLAYCSDYDCGINYCHSRFGTVHLSCHSCSLMPFSVLVTSLGLVYDVGFEITPGKKRKTSFRGLNV